MAIEANRIYGINNELFDEEAQEMIKSGELRNQLEFVRACATPEDSKALNDVKEPCMIMAGNGNCNGGRIIHHLRNNLHLPETAVLFVGFQSPGSLGRQLVDGAQEISIFGEKIPVRASVHTMGGFSAHAGQRDLLDWFAAVAPSRPRVIITHGEDKARKALSEQINLRHGLTTECPELGDCLEI